MSPGNPDDLSTNDDSATVEGMYSSIPQPSEMAGQRFGPYQIVREIGRGGMGAVYLAARADDQFKQRVALKILRGAFNPHDVLRRFKHERQILATLSHPNICTLLDGGSTPSGEPYLVMDYIEGISIDRYCDRNGLSIRQRIELFRQVCSAVQYVHQNLIVHRDLKPGNILVTPDGVAKLLDFGIAKILKPELIMTVLDATATGTHVMTPAYASPEQVRGEPITTASDVYSLGVILYELLTGRRPYRLKSGSAHELPRAILEDEPEKPSTAITRVDKSPLEKPVTVEELSRQRATLPDKLYRRLKGDIDNILLKALRKEPQRRYSSVELFSEDLRRHLESLPVSAHQDSFSYRAAKFFQRHKVPVIAAAIALLSLVGGLITTIVEMRVARSERALAESRFQDVRKLATTFLFDVHGAIQNLPGSTPARSLIARTGTEYLDRLASQAQGDASLQLEVADGYLKIGDVEGDPFGANLGEWTNAIASYRKALDIAQSLVNRNGSDRNALKALAWAHFQLAGVLPFADKTSEALAHSGEALKIYRRILALQPADIEARLDVSRGLERQGDLLGGMQSVNLGRKEEAAAAYSQALDLIPNLPPGHALAMRAARGRVLMTMKLASSDAGVRNRIEVLDRYKDALRIAEDSSQANPNDRPARELMVYVLNKIAGAQQSFGDFKSAEATYSRAVEMDEAGMKADPDNAGARQAAMGRQKNFGDLYFYSLRNWPEALRCYRRAAALMEIETTSDPNSPVWRQRYSEVLTSVASCLLRMGQPEEARRQAKRGLDMARELADRPNATRDHKYNYAWLAVTVEPTDLQEPARALPYALKAVEMGGSSDEYSLHVLAQAYAGVGDYAHAIEAERKGLALFPASGPGTVKSGMQQIMESMLAECREKLNSPHHPKQ